MRQNMTIFPDENFSDVLCIRVIGDTLQLFSRGIENPQGGNLKTITLPGLTGTIGSISTISAENWLKSGHQANLVLITSSGRIYTVTKQATFDGIGSIAAGDGTWVNEP